MIKGSIIDMSNKKLGLWVLTALVVGNMVGSGIFMLPRSLAEVASPSGVLWAWLLTGGGVLLTALVFKEGSQASALAGYIVAWGYWVANFAGNIAIITTFASYLSTFFPILTSEAPLFNIGSFTVKTGNLLTFLVCSALLWGMHALILHGIEGAGKVNFAATAAKVLGFAFFIIVALWAFQASNLLPMNQPRVDEGGATVGLLGQINNAAVATLWAFVGVESAVVFSSRARRQKDVKRATILGLVIALVIYMGITVLVMGALTQETLIASEKPLVDALNAVFGSSGSYLMAGLAGRLDGRLDHALVRSAVPSGQARHVPPALRQGEQ